MKELISETIADMFATLDKQLRAESLFPVSSLNGILVYDLCDTGALFYQLSLLHVAIFTLVNENCNSNIVFFF